MIRSDVSETVKRRLGFNRYCPICKLEIKDFQDFQYVAFKKGMHKCYRFFHTECLVNERGYNNGKVEENEIEETENITQSLA